MYLYFLLEIRHYDLFHAYRNLQMSATLYSILSFSDIRKQKKVFLYLLEFVDSRYVLYFLISYRFYH